MPDPFSGSFGTTKQELSLLAQNEEQKKLRGPSTEFKGSKRREKSKADDSRTEEPKTPSASLYKKGKELMEASGFFIELVEGGPHINHQLFRPQSPQEVEGITYPNLFKPLLVCVDELDLGRIDKAFHPAVAEQAVRDFWEPFYRPKDGDSELLSYTRRRLKMDKLKEARYMHEPKDFGHSFDPAGRIEGSFVNNPRIWVPDREWFKPALQDVKFEDVFTIFPYAECQLLKLLIGRIGVGRNNHRPPSWNSVVEHTARMAAVIVGKDPGLGKSTLFNGLVAAISKCGFTTHTFRSTEDRFGLKEAALSDVSYKDDTSLQSLKRFLMSEETKTLITNGIFQVEEKFEKPEKLMAKTVFIVNSNEWNSKFAYDLDPGIIDRIKLISTCRENEVKKMASKITGVSQGSPDLRPRAHIPWLANKLGVSQDALYLWCLRLATDYFWEIISDKRDPSVNRLQVEVRTLTSKQRIRFKADVIQALVNGMAFAHALRTNADSFFMPELTPHVLYQYMKSFYFIGVDPSCLDLMTHMKKDWEAAGRPSTHYYQGFREIRWESVKKSLTDIRGSLYEEETEKKRLPQGKTSASLIKEMVEQLMVRDGFKLGGDANYVIEHWANTRFAQDELVEEGHKLLVYMNQYDINHMRNMTYDADDDWMGDTRYSPDNAERFRSAARSKLYQKYGYTG